MQYLNSSREGNKRREADDIGANGVRETPRRSYRQSLHRFGSCTFCESRLRASARGQRIEQIIHCGHKRRVFFSAKVHHYYYFFLFLFI